MKNHRIIFILLLILCVLPLQASYVIGTYNIRVQTTADTGAMDWTNRKEYVARSISESGMDVCGLNEVKSTPKKDLAKLLTDYTVEYWGRDSWQISNSGEGVGIAFRKDKLTKLEMGHFFLAPDITKNDIGWDAGYRRLAVWMKLKDKVSGDIFYFCTTHLDYSGVVARRKEAELIVNQMQKIAGSSPCIIAGDCNSLEQEIDIHMPFLSYFYNSYGASETTPIGDGTMCWWGTQSNLRIDHIYVHGFRVLNYTTITETFGRTVTPSDHLPIKIEVELSRNPQTIVCQSGLQQILDSVLIGDTIDLQGREIEDSALLVKTSVVLRNGIFRHSSISVTSPASLHVLNCRFVGSNHAISSTGYSIFATSCDFDSCATTGDGGAIVTSGRLLLSDCRFKGNSASNSGGAVAVKGTYWGIRADSCLFENNSAVSGAALAVNGTDDIAIRRSSFIKNQATNHGALLWNDESHKTQLQLLNCCFTQNRAAEGSSMYFSGDTASVLSLLNCTMVRDTNATGAAAMLNSGKARLYNNLMIENISAGNDRDISISESVNVLGNMNNITTATTPDTAFLGELHYVNNLAFVPVLKATYASQSVNVLTPSDLSETTWGEDINDDGKYDAFLSVDLLGRQRSSMAATIGAYEFIHSPSGLEQSIMSNDVIRFIYNGQIFIKKNNRVYTIIGKAIY